MTNPENHPMHIDNAQARHAARQNRRLIFPSLFVKIERGLMENDAADMRAASFPQSVIDSWTAETDGSTR